MTMPGIIDKIASRKTQDTVPEYIIELAAEALSEHDDGYMRERTKQKLIEIRDYINITLSKCETEHHDASRN
jgi:hypothetical protein